MPTYLRTTSPSSPGPRSYSFPPCDPPIPISHPPSTSSRSRTQFQTPSPSQDLPDIDDDPFAHFISPVSDDDDPYDVLSLSAGIIVSDATSSASATSTSPKTSKFKSSVAEKWARYVRLHHVQLHQRYHDDDDDDGDGVAGRDDGDDREEEEEDDESFVQLDDDRLLDTLHTAPQLRGPPPIFISPPASPEQEDEEDEDEDEDEDLGLTLEMEPTRGRAQELLASGKKAAAKARVRPRARGRRRYGNAAALMGATRRRRSWREPSPDLFTVEESASEGDEA
ncbi:uncharacterized protein EI97DRAFT_445824 [Westerdykella ornata]|uniref:Uncharacterized protein n=1 Tax=Westerdykella ornata TaxID=318751 RepID=A0A6A6J720_WESOR|nr:uncharacterized protein EI97DRAFT_445824 [Westerdykella ornata]KAF2272370.1 hypothetical protein EI97DRAFT_445824 [Westerdykella ornata]